MGRKFWNVRQYDKAKASALARACGVDDFAVLLLQSRGIDTPEAVEAFLSEEEGELSSPFLIKDMDRAAARIRHGVERGEKILVYGDYDADGVTSTALLTSYLETVGANVAYYIPSRLKEGYGLSLEAAARIVEEGFQLVITVDNGISAIEEAAYFKEHGVDMVITDHHKAGPVLPDAIAVVDPHRPDDESPEKELAGVGVAMKLAAALEDGEFAAVLEDFADIVAIGTVADIVPLTGENRTIVKMGLAALNNCCRPGLCALIESIGYAEKPLNSSAVAFGIAPRINAAGRMDSADAALNLLLTDDEDEAQELVKKVNDANAQRQAVESAISEDVEAYFDAAPEKRLDRVMVAAGKGWHPGVIGIVASRVVEKYGRPAVVISIGEDGVCKGSGRSIEGFSLYEALSYAGDTLIQFGGHTLAAGFSVLEENIEPFRKKLNEYAATVAHVYPSVNIDCRLNPANITTDILDSLNLLEPFGAKNPAPVFGLFNMTLTGVKPIGNNKHLRLTLARGGASLTAVWFGQTGRTFPFAEGDTVDAAIRIERNDYMGETRLSIQVKDMRPSGTDDEALFAAEADYKAFRRGERLSGELLARLCPDRALIADIYRYIKDRGAWRYEPEILCMRIGADAARAGAVCAALEALCDAGILARDAEGYRLTDFNGKTDLAECGILKALGYK